MEITSLKSFDPSSWEAINTAFENAPTLALSQAWLEETQKNFLPAQVQLGWQEDALLIRACLVDENPFSSATADNQDLWVLGDVFEVFIKDAARENYLELHIAPNGHRLQLSFPDAGAIDRIRDKELKLAELLVSDPLFELVQRSTSDGWEVFIRLPAASMESTPASLQASGILASFSRYDYVEKDSQPVLSSTSPHKVANFHRQEEWKKFSLGV